MEVWLPTIVGGLLVVLIGLGVEYWIIQPWRKKQEALKISPELEPKPTPMLQKDESLPWTQAIKKAMGEFCTLHEGKEVSLNSTETDFGRATLLVSVLEENFRDNKHYVLSVDKWGNIVQIKKQI